MRHETLDGKCDRQGDDAEKHAADPAEEQEITKHRSADGSDEHGEQAGDQAETIGRAEVDGENAIAVAGDAEEGGLAKRERAAIAPDQAKAQSHESPVEEIDVVADGVAIDEKRIDNGGRDNDSEARPEQQAAPHGLRAFEMLQKIFDRHGRNFSRAL